MRDVDLSPLFRSLIGFDRMARSLDLAGPGDGYPPYNIEKLGEDRYRVTLAVAGFSDRDLTITAKDQTLTIEGRQAEPETQRAYLHRGIAGRSFKRVFHLADYIRVDQAQLADGLLNVDLVREVPEAMKPRTIQIATGPQRPTLTTEAA